MSATCQKIFFYTSIHYTAIVMHEKCIVKQMHRHKHSDDALKCIIRVFVSVHLHCLLKYVYKSRSNYFGFVIVLHFFMLIMLGKK